MERIIYFAQFLEGTRLPKPNTENLINRLLDYTFIFLGALAVLLFVIAGLQYVLSQGDPAKISQSKMRLVHIAVGLAVAALAAAMVNFIIESVG